VEGVLGEHTQHTVRVERVRELVAYSYHWSGRASRSGVGGLRFAKKEIAFTAGRGAFLRRRSRATWSTCGTRALLRLHAPGYCSGEDLTCVRVLKIKVVGCAYVGSIDVLFGLVL
jgi:hypothetical protein